MRSTGIPNAADGSSELPGSTDNHRIICGASANDLSEQPNSGGCVGTDFLDVDGLLSGDERLVRDSTRAFIDAELKPVIEACYREGRFPRELVKPMGTMGFFGANLEGYGCAGMNNVEYGLMTQELERGDSGVRSFVSVQSALVMYPIYTFGSGAQKERWLPGMAKGELLGCFGLTEPDFGSNPGGMRSRAKRDGEEYVLNGEKMWITSGSHRRCGNHLGERRERRRKDARIPGRNGSSGVQGDRRPRQMVAAGLGDVGALHAGCPGARDKSPARHRRSQVTLDVPQSGAVRHRMGSDRGGHGLLRNGARVCQGAEAVSGSADCQPPAGAGKTGLDGDRDHKGSAPLLAGRPAQGCRQGLDRADLHGQAEQTSGWPSRRRAWRATSWVRQGSWTTTRSCGT